ncbi:hypothetical protein T484DRAFT_1795434, partial [Baffinella frigidus]
MAPQSQPSWPGKFVPGSQPRMESPRMQAASNTPTNLAKQGQSNGGHAAHQTQRKTAAVPMPLARSTMGQAGAMQQTRKGNPAAPTLAPFAPPGATKINTPFSPEARTSSGSWTPGEISLSGPWMPGGGANKAASSPAPALREEPGHFFSAVGKRIEKSIQFPLGRYEIKRKLGSGQYGKVLECVDEKYGVRVAVKIVRRDPPIYRDAAKKEIK